MSVVDGKTEELIVAENTGTVVIFAAESGDSAGCTMETGL